LSGTFPSRCGKRRLWSLPAAASFPQLIFFCRGPSLFYVALARWRAVLIERRAGRNDRPHVVHRRHSEFGLHVRKHSPCTRLTRSATLSFLAATPGFHN